MLIRYPIIYRGFSTIPWWLGMGFSAINRTAPLWVAPALTNSVPPPGAPTGPAGGWCGISLWHLEARFSTKNLFGTWRFQFFVDVILSWICDVWFLKKNMNLVDSGIDYHSSSAWILFLKLLNTTTHQQPQPTNPPPDTSNVPLLWAPQRFLDWNQSVGWLIGSMALVGPLLQFLVEGGGTQYDKMGGCFLKWWYPQIIHFKRGFHYKPSILGYPYFWQHPDAYGVELLSFCQLLLVATVWWTFVLALPTFFLTCISVKKSNKTPGNIQQFTTR